jgi:Kelch motif
MDDIDNAPRAVRAALIGSALVFALVACGSSTGGGGSHGTDDPLPVIESFTAEPGGTFVGERVRLTAVFRGERATIDGVGPVESGKAVDTPALARTTTFVLVVHEGARTVEARVTAAVSYRDRFRELEPSPVARTRHLATALPDGGALVMGGNTSESLNVPDSDTSQRFDPAEERLSAGPQLAFTAEAGFTSAVRSGLEELLLVGGGPNTRGGTVASQSFDAKGQFVRVDDLNLQHGAGGAVTTLADGRVLVTGGDVPPGAAVEVRDPADGHWAVTGDLLVARRGHTATLLADGRVLVVGGVSCCVAGSEVLIGTAELYDPVEGSSLPTASLSVARGFHEATLLSDGRVLVTGGLAGMPASPIVSTEMYDPATGEFGPAGDLQAGHVSHHSVLLADGRVLVLGGLDVTAVTEIFDPASNRWTPGPPLQPPRAEPTATLLSSGRVLVFGGQDAAGFPIAAVGLFE